MFSIREAQFSFVISIQAFEQVKKVFDNKTITEWVEGGNIKLNYQKRSGFGQYGRVRETVIFIMTMVIKYTRKNAQVVTSLQTSSNKSVYKLSTSCVRTACS